MGGLTPIGATGLGSSFLEVVVLILCTRWYSRDIDYSWCGTIIHMAVPCGVPCKVTLPGALCLSV